MLSGAKETLLARVRTPYQTIELTRIEDDNKYALYLDGAVQFVSGFDDRVYHGVLATLPARMLKGRRGKALILGGGDGLAARNLLQHPNIEEVRMIELDPVMIEFCSKNPIMRQLNRDAFRNPRLKVTAVDARKWVAESPEAGYSIAILDFPDPLENDLEDLFEEPFYRRVQTHLTGDPIWSVQSSSAFSDTEDKVRRNLIRVTRTPVYPVRFRGEWMQDGSIVFSGAGVDPSYTRLPHEYRSTEGIQLSGSIL